MISREDRTGVAAGDFPLVEAGDNRLVAATDSPKAFA